MDADHAAFGDQSPQDIVGDVGRIGTYRAQSRVTGDDGSAAGGDDLALGGLSGMRNIDQHAEPVHLRDQAAAFLVDAGPFDSAAHAGVRVGVGHLARKLDHAHAEAIPEPQDVDIAFLIEPGFDAEHDGELAAGHDAPHVGGSERELHLVAMRFQRPVERLDQTSGLFHRGVIGVVPVGRDVFDDEVDAAGAGAGVIELTHGLRLPGIDAFPVDAVGDVDVAVGQNGHGVLALRWNEHAEGKQQKLL